MLSEKNIEEAANWDAAKELLIDDERFKAAPSEMAQKQWYMEHLETCVLEGWKSLKILKY